MSWASQTGSRSAGRARSSSFWRRITSRHDQAEGAALGLILAGSQPLLRDRRRRAGDGARRPAAGDAWPRLVLRRDRASPGRTAHRDGDCAYRRRALRPGAPRLHRRGHRPRADRGGSGRRHRRPPRLRGSRSNPGALVVGLRGCDNPHATANEGTTTPITRSSTAPAPAEANLPHVSAARLREVATRGAQLLAASGFALAQPLFDLLGKNAEFFAVRGSTPSDIVVFALVVTFVPALVLFAVEAAVGAVSRRASFARHLVFLAGLGAVFGVQALKHLEIHGTTVLIAGAVLVGLAVALAFWRLQPARSFLTVLVAAPFVFLARVPVRHPRGEAGVPERAAPRSRGERPSPDAHRPPPLRRVSGERPRDRRGRDRRRPLPELRPPRPEVGLVPQHDDRVRLDHLRRARDPDREPAEARCAPDRPGLPEQPVHPARRALPDGGDRVADPALPEAALQAQASRYGFAPVLALLRRAHRLPPPARSARAGGAPPRDRRVLDELRRGHHGQPGRGHEASEDRHAHLLQGPRSRLQPLRRLVPSPGAGAADAVLHPRAPATHAVGLPPRRPRARARPDERTRACRRAVVRLRSRGAALAASPAPGRLHRPVARPLPQAAPRDGALGQGADHRHARSRDQLPRGRS